jgi:PAS domain S-box-containing protein
MNFLDMRTVIFTMLVTNSLCTLLLIFLWRQNRSRFEGIHCWVADFALQTAALLLIVSRGGISDWMSIVLSNTMVVAGSIIGYRGLELFVRKKVPQIQNLVLLAVFPLIHSYYTFVQPSLAARTLNLSTALLIVCCQCLWLLFRGVGPAMRLQTQGVGIVFGAFCMLSIVRIVNFFLSSPIKNDFFHSGVFETLVLVCYQILLILLTYSLSLMVNKCLLGEIRLQEEKFSKAFHSSPDAITLSNLSDGRIFEVNDGFERMTGYASAEIVGKTSVEINLLHRQGDRADLVDELSRTGSLRGKEVQLRKKSGDIAFGLCSAEIIAMNDQRIVLSSISDITERKRKEEEREVLICELQKALSEIKTLSGMLPICSRCKKIRDDQGYWKQIEAYISERSDAEFSHGICPDCMKILYPGFADTTDENGRS